MNSNSNSKKVIKSLVSVLMILVKFFSIIFASYLIIYGSPLNTLGLIYGNASEEGFIIFNLILISISTYWLFKKVVTQRGVKTSFLIYTVAISVFLFPIQYFSIKNDRVTLDRPLQVEGYSMRGISILFLNEDNQSIVSSFYDLLPLSVSYFARLHDEIFFVFDSKRLIDNNKECQPYYTKCSNAIFSNLKPNMRTSSYYILSTAVYASTIFEERSQTKNEKSYDKYKTAYQLSDWSINTANSFIDSPYNELWFEKRIGEKFDATILKRVEKLISSWEKGCEKSICEKELSDQKRKMTALKRKIASKE